MTPFEILKADCKNNSYKNMSLLIDLACLTGNISDEEHVKLESLYSEEEINEYFSS